MRLGWTAHVEGSGPRGEGAPHSLELLEGLAAGRHVLAARPQRLQLEHRVPARRREQAPHAERHLHPLGELVQQRLEGGHGAPRQHEPPAHEERVPVAVHEDGLGGRGVHQHVRPARAHGRAAPGPPDTARCPRAGAQSGSGCGTAVRPRVPAWADASRPL